MQFQFVLFVLVLLAVACGDEEGAPTNNIVFEPDVANNSTDMADTGDMADMADLDDMLELPSDVVLDLSPRPMVLRRSEQRRIVAVLRYDEGEEIPITSITYESNNLDVATVDELGLVLGVSGGQATITVTANGIQGNLGVQVYTRTDGISAGRTHTCAAKVDGRAICWGDNTFKQAGGADGTPGLTPSEIVFPSEDQVMDVFVGYDHSCASFDGEGAIRCWGNNRSGELGDDIGGDRASGVQPVAFSSPAEAGALGDGFTCFRLETGALRCSGSNRTKVISNDAVETVRSMVAVHENEQFIQIAAGRAHMCGIRENFSMVCWGANDQGQLGPMGPAGGSHALIPIMGNYTMVSAFADQTCAFSPFTGVQCWGKSTGGFGTSQTTQTSTPVVVDLPAGTVRQLAVGRDHACAVLDSSVHCWGQNANGQLGDQTLTSRATAAPVVGGDSLQPIACGGNHCCGVGTTGDTFCWGSNSDGQLGDGTTMDRRVPSFVFPTAF